MFILLLFSFIINVLLYRKSDYIVNYTFLKIFFYFIFILFMIFSIKHVIIQFYFFLISFFLFSQFSGIKKLLYINSDSSPFLFRSLFSSNITWLSFLVSFNYSHFLKKASKSLHCKSYKHRFFLNTLKIKKFIRWSSRYKRWWWSVSNIFLSAATLAFFIRSEFTKNKSLSTIFKMLKSSVPFNVKGFLLILKGRPHGAPRSTKKIIKLGYLHFTHSVDTIDFFFLKLQNRFGICGLKIWINTITNLHLK